MASEKQVVANPANAKRSNGLCWYILDQHRSKNGRQECPHICLSRSKHLIIRC
jgi:hypothetical protein